MDEKINWAQLESQDRMMKYFRYEHLPLNLQTVSIWFFLLAQKILTLPQNPERTVALRKLLEAKDCAVRTSL